MPGILLPRLPGHEVIGRIDAVGAGVGGWIVGERVGVRWHGGYWGRCDPCRRGQPFACVTGPPVTGVAHDGGYGECTIAPATSLARVPDGLSAEEAARLMCAGLTTFDALRNGGARPGALVAMHGLGGLRHLAVQYAAKMGFHTVAVARGADKVPWRRRSARTATSTARPRIPRRRSPPWAARVACSPPSPTPDAMSAMIGGLGIDVTLMVVGAPPAPLAVPVFPMIRGRRRVQGWYSGTSTDAQDPLAFSLLTGVRSMNETFPLARAAEAWRMMSGKARFRVVLRMRGRAGSQPSRVERRP